jgi:hypothetical protein
VSFFHTVKSCISETVRNWIQIHKYFLRTITDSMTTKNIELSSWDIVYYVGCFNNRVTWTSFGMKLERPNRMQTPDILIFYFFYFCLNPLLFGSCTDTFSKWCKITRGMKRSAQ